MGLFMDRGDRDFEMRIKGLMLMNREQGQDGINNIEILLLVYHSKTSPASNRPLNLYASLAHQV